MAENFFNDKLKQVFSKYSFKINTVKGKDQIIPIKKDPLRKTTLTSEQFPSYVNQLWLLWKQNQASIYEFDDRKKLYAEMDTMYNNNAIISRGIDLTVHEIIQADVNDRVITVESSSKDQKRHIEEFFDRIGIDGLLFATAKDLVKYGDSFWVASFFENGVSEILLSDPYDVEDRIEFTPSEVEKQLKNNSFGSIFKNITNDNKLKMLAKTIMSKEDYSSFFRSYLFGFQVGSYILPPWRCFHFRNFETNSFFRPFGTPAYIQALAPSKTYDIALGLQIIARQSRFPTDVFNLNIPTGASPLDKLELVTEFIKEWQNSGLKQVRKEQVGVGEQIVTIKDLIEYEQFTPSLDLGRIDDLELLRDDIILAMGIPRNFVDPNNGNFGSSGISLVQQFKPFARVIYKFQSIILEQITQLVKIDMIQSGKFELDEIDFKLSMPYPESQTNPELITSQRDLFTMANDILDGVKERLGGEIQLPVDLIKDVYRKVTSFDPVTIDSWIDQFVAERERVEKENQSIENNTGNEGENKDLEPDFTFESIQKKIGSKQIYSIIENEVTNQFLRKTEHTSNNKHWYSSRKANHDFDIKFFSEINIQGRLNLLNEELKNTDLVVKAVRKNSSKIKFENRKEIMKEFQNDKDINYPEEE